MLIKEIVYTFHLVQYNLYKKCNNNVCNITYRLFDWNRVDKNGKSRELHIEKAINTIKFNNKAKKYQSNCNKETNEAIKNKFFNVEKIIVKEIFKSHSNINTLFIMNVIEKKERYAIQAMNMY